jgi:RHS repeat-associated protein
MAAKARTLFLSLAAFCLPAMANVPGAPLLSEKPRQGVHDFTDGIASGSAAANALSASEISESEYDFRVGPRCTGKERDAETGLDYFGARYMSSAQGRFTSPDWSATPQAVPYADLTDPQTLNLYAYVRNNPLSRRDLDGHADVAALCEGQSTCQKTVTNTVNIVHYDRKSKQTVVDSTVKITTNFSLTTGAKGKVNVSATSTVANVSGHQYSDSQLATMGKSIGAVQQSAVTMGFGNNTTQMMTALGAAETAFGTARATEASPFKAPDINPLQLSGGRANGDLMHNIQGALGVFDYFGRKIGFDPIPTYRRYSDGSVPTMANFTSIYGSVVEEVK